MIISTIKNKKNLEKQKKRVNYTIAVIFWLVFWQMASISIGHEVLLPSPLSVLKSITNLFVEIGFWSAILGSMIRISIGFIMACSIGVLLAILCHKFELINIIASPVISVIKAIPVASFVILALVWVKSQNLSLLISFLIVLPVIYTNTIRGIENIDQDLVEMAKIYKISMLKRVVYVYSPLVMPFFLSGVTSGIGLCWKSGIAAEVIGMPANSIGENLYRAKILLETSDLFAWTVTIVVISTIYEKVIIRLMSSLDRKLS